MEPTDKQRKKLRKEGEGGDAGGSEVKNQDNKLSKRKIDETEGDSFYSKKPRLNVTKEDVIIELEVGGKRIATFQSTLCKVPDSKLADMFSQDPIPFKKNDKGWYILERPRKPFRIILNYLRTGKFHTSLMMGKNSGNGEEEKSLLMKEIQYWGMQAAYEKEAGAYFEGSSLVDPSQQLMLNKWYGQESQKWKLIYKASRDGWESSDFHNKVDHTGPTLTIIQANGYLFGGYTPIEWTSRGGYAGWNPNCWIFSLTNPSGEAIKMLNDYPKGKKYMYSIFDDKDYGPVFGGGYDIGIQSCSNKSNQNYSNLGYNFVLPGRALGTEEAKNFLTGSFYFTVSEIETFALDSKPTDHLLNVDHSNNNSNNSNNAQ